MVTQTKTNQATMQRALIFAAICLALCLVLPFLTGQIPQIGAALSPMHLPALLCGFLCGPWYAAAVGFVAPLLRYLLFGMPPIFPVGVSMAFELAAYGMAAGLLYRALPKKTGYLYLSLIGAMLAGRVVWGAVRLLLSGVAGEPFTLRLFLAGAFINAVPGILVHILLVPALVLALRRAGLTGTS